MMRHRNSAHKGTSLGSSDLLHGVTHHKQMSYTDPTQIILPKAQEDLIKRNLMERGDDGSLIITAKGRAFLRRQSL